MAVDVHKQNFGSKGANFSQSQGDDGMCNPLNFTCRDMGLPINFFGCMPSSPASACMLHLLSMIFGTSIPMSIISNGNIVWVQQCLSRVAT